MSTTIAPYVKRERASTAPGSPRPVLAVINARASRARDPEALRIEVREALLDAGATAQAVVTESPAELRDVVAHAAGRRIALVGGDGAVHAVANLDLPLPELALIPSGRANNIARALAVPTDLRSAAAIAVNAPARPLDALEVRTPERRILAVEGVSAGFQAAARARYRATNSGAVARGALALAQTLVALPHYAARLSLDGSPAPSAPLEQLFLSTLPYFAFGLRVDPVADVRDGAAEAIAFTAPTRRHAARMLLAARAGRHLELDGVALRRFHRAELLDAMPLAADGEPLGNSTARVEVLPGALRIATAEQG